MITHLNEDTASVLMFTNGLEALEILEKVSTIQDEERRSIALLFPKVLNDRKKNDVKLRESAYRSFFKVMRVDFFILFM